MSTWIGLAVRCNDPRWNMINQLGKDDDEPHVTLAYLGDIDLSNRRQRQLAGAVVVWSRRCMPPFNYKLNVLAYDAFAGNTTVLKVGESKPCLLARHSALITQLKELVLPVNEDYEFVPHVTVGHGTYKRPNYDLDGLSFSIKSLFVKHNGNYLIDRRFLGGRV